MGDMRATIMRWRVPLVLGVAGFALSGCLSLGAEPPESLLTLTPAASAPIGAAASSGGESGQGAIAVLTPEVPAKLDVLRIPVIVSDTEIAYLQEAFWVEKPSRLFRRLLGESLRARLESSSETPPLVIDNEGTPVLADTYLRGTLSELSYDAQTSSVVVRFDAVRSNAQGAAITRRFEARESGVVASPGSVGAALNRAANTVADEVSAWMTE